MKPYFAILFVGAFLVGAVQAQATILPDACGNDNVKFDVKAERSKTPPAPPAEGKAQIVFIEDENQALAPFKYATIRFGLDGAWAGANNNNSYFTVSVDPGEHHVCVSWQSALSMLKKSIDVASFSAEPGRTYYFAANVKVIPADGSRNSNPTFDFNLAQLEEDAGKYRVKAWKQATWTTR